MNRVSPKTEPADITLAGRETNTEPPKTVRVEVTRNSAPAPVGPLHRSDLAVRAIESDRLDLKPGQNVLGFTLIERLGEGAFAQVFLAEQDAIAGRSVVVKVTPARTAEPERLGRLQHPNIVPIHSVHEHGEHELICMPFLGRRTLANVIAAGRRRDSWFSTRLAPRSTRHKPDCAAGAADPTRTRVAPAIDGNTPVPDNFPYPEVDVRWVLWLLSGLAAGLDHAHRRGILHLDIKPANVLLADAGEPMLLDFNLSHDTTGRFREAVGGTVPYMAPEQLAELLTRGTEKVDERTDLYGLGTLAYELLTNEQPYPAGWMSRAELEKYLELRHRPAPSARAKNPLVSPAVSAIVAKLLAPDPADRYQTALELKTDLDRQLADLPLLAAPDRSMSERFAKWRRRNPWVPLRLTLACVVGLSLGFAGLLYRHESSAREGAAIVEAQRARASLTTLRLDLASPGDAQARARGCAEAEQRLAAFGLPDDPDWRVHAPFARLPEADRTAVAEDLGEILVLLAHARWRGRGALPEGERAELPQTCARLLDRAEGCFAPGKAPPFLFALRAEFAAARGEPITSPTATAATARDHYLDAVGLIAGGKFHAALVPLTRATALEPGHGPAHFALGFCRQKLGQYSRALERYDTAHALMPRDPRPVFNRGLVYGAMKKPHLAEAEFALAIEIDPAHAESYRNRAVARLSQGKTKWESAEQDLTAALEHGAPPIPVYQLRATVRTLREDTRGAEADRQAAKAYEPRTEGDFLARGRSRLPTDPAGALADFEHAATLNPGSLAALQNQAHVYSEYKKDSEKSLALVTRAVELYPEYAPARAGRAVLLARLGQRDQAHKDAERALMHSDDPTITYQLAGVFAQTSATHPADADRALDLLRRALRAGFSDFRTLGADPDLNPIRNRPEFIALAKWIKELPRD